MAIEKKNEKNNRRNEIIKIATAMFLEEGYAATSMSKISKKCGIQKASLYYHFSSKEEMFIESVTHGYNRALEVINEIRKKESLSDEEKLCAAMDCLYEITISSPVGRLSPLIAEVSRTIPEVANSFFHNYIAKQHEIMGHIINDGIINGSFSKQDIPTLMHLIFGPVVTLSLSKEMFLKFPEIDDHFPTKQLRDGHKKQMLRILTNSE